MPPPPLARTLLLLLGMSLISAFVPHPRISEASHAAVDAPVGYAWDVVRALDLYEIPYLRAYLDLRLLPTRARALLRGRADTHERHAHLDDLVAPGRRLALLGEVPGREIVIGAIGRFWKPDIEWRSVAPDAFAGFDEPGWGKLAWNLRVDPHATGGAWVSCELRLTATDAAAWRSFRRYWRVFGPVSRLVRRAALRRLRGQLGRGGDGRRNLPGDELLPEVRFERTHRRVIEAPPSQLWPWLVQMGADRAGWYAIDRLDHRGVPSARHIIPELQHLELGDLILSRSRGPDALAVLRLEPPRVLVIGTPTLSPCFDEPPGRELPYRMTWAFVLEPVGDVATELVVRVRATYAPSLRTELGKTVLGLEHELMERAQLRHLAERAAPC